MSKILVAALIGLLTTMVSPGVVFADSLSIESWSTGMSLSATNLNSRQTTIQNLINGNLDSSNLKSSANVKGSQLDLTDGTGRISQSTSVTNSAPILTSAQTWNDASEVFTGWQLNITNTNSASTSRLIDLQVGGTTIASLSRTGQLFLNSQDYASGSSGVLRGVWFNIASATFTDNQTPASGTAPQFIAYAFQRPAVAAANSSVTTTNAATVFIASAPVAGDNMTLTNRYALWVAGGNTRLPNDTYLLWGATGGEGPAIYGETTVLDLLSGTTAIVFKGQTGTERMRLTNAGILALGTTMVTSAAAPALVLANAGQIRTVNAAGTNTYSLIYADANDIIQVGGQGTLVSSFYIANASLPAGAAANNGAIGVDSTNNRFIFYSGGNRYYITGTGF